MVRPRTYGTVQAGRNRTSKEDMLSMSGNHRMSAREHRSPVWDIRESDSARTMEIAAKSWLSESLKTRILQLRSTLYELAETVERLPESELKAQISRRIVEELSILEWELIT